MTLVSGMLLLVTVGYGLWAGAVDSRYLPPHDSEKPPSWLPLWLQDSRVFTTRGREQRRDAWFYLRRMYFFGFLFFAARCAGL
jgi:hypothetical protein